ncbi:PEP-CTERM sorting domain-containing protein [Massilia sp. TW-1]|uniref:PEP-CTERM sorting domain-containing protein n=1 Tax=Telluria antibiotica TaxID=2717319 RepID=A0ABX0P4U3_9BURK|nr:PEP-CTERM sorting domain-containing protein [Telluria antibiotica]NIA52252.1 PEP-CTERM sorting domain-containing protein [Telluria antibiotica]
MKKLIALFIVSAFAQADAAPLLTNVGLSTAVTFDEVATGAGNVVTNQFAAQGVTFSTNGSGNWYASGNPGGYSGIANFSGTYLDSFSGGPAASEYRIQFGSAVSAAGAWFEFNTSSPAATFSSYLGNVMQESYTYNNGSCCDSAQFVGFTGNFDEIRFNGITGRDFIMDSLDYTPANRVPEPGTLALLGAGLLGTVLRRRAKNA